MKLPVLKPYNHTYTAQIDNTTIQVTFEYISDAWYLSLADIVTRLKVVYGMDLLAPFTNKFSLYLRGEALDYLSINHFEKPANYLELEDLRGR